MQIILLIIALTTFLLILDMYATVRLWQNPSFALGQKIAQVLIVWLLPLLGALLVLLVMHEDPWQPGEPLTQWGHTVPSKLGADSMLGSGEHGVF